jgi:hypothetical protein
VCGTQRFGGCERVDEEGSAAVHAVAQAVQYLEAWRTFKVPAWERRGGGVNRYFYIAV